MNFVCFLFDSGNFFVGLRIIFRSFTEVNSLEIRSSASKFLQIELQNSKTLLKMNFVCFSFDSGNSFIGFRPETGAKVAINLKLQYQNLLLHINLKPGYGE